MIHSASDHPGEALRDYAFDELPHGERAAVEQHVATCAGCALELDRLRVTTAALRALPDRDIPQRIAFVSDRVFEPNWFRRFWNSGAQLGFASACVLAAALVVSAWHFTAGKTTAVRPVVQTAAASQPEIDAAVAKAVAQVRQEVRQQVRQEVQAEDMRLIQAAEKQRDTEYRNQMIAINEYFSVQQKHDSVRLALSETPGAGAGQ